MIVLEMWRLFLHDCVCFRMLRWRRGMPLAILSNTSVHGMCMCACVCVLRYAGCINAELLWFVFSYSKPVQAKEVCGRFDVGGLESYLDCCERYKPIGHSWRWAVLYLSCMVVSYDSLLSYPQAQQRYSTCSIGISYCLQAQHHANLHAVYIGIDKWKG